MSSEMYTLVALAMRYVFAALMLLIVARAWKITIIDARRAGSLRRLAPETGLCGEFIVINGEGRAREGARYPVIREGLIGASRKADVRVRAKSVRRMHAFFELSDRGLRVRAQNHARMYDASGASRREITLGDGGRVTIGGVEMMLILVNGQTAPEQEKRIDDIFTSAELPAPETPAHTHEIQDEIPGWDNDATQHDAVILGWDDSPEAVREVPKENTVIPGWDDSPEAAREISKENTVIPGWDEEWDERPKKKREAKKRDDDFFDI